MKRQIFLPVIPEHPYFCFPESVGWYKDECKHYVHRQKEEMNNFNLHIIISGKGYLRSNDLTYTMQAGDCFLYFPNEEQLYYSDEENPWEVLWVHWNGTYLKEFLVERGFHTSHVWTLKSLNHMKQAILALLEEAEEFTILHPSTLSNLTYGILVELITQAVPITNTRGTKLYDKIVDLLPLMRECSNKPFQLEDWSEHLQISTFYFCKVFKKVTGMTPTRFITLCRIQKAKQLLIEKREWSVKQIAIEVGYPSISYFGRLFLENEGVTPMEYRNKLS